MNTNVSTSPVAAPCVSLPGLEMRLNHYPDFGLYHSAFFNIVSPLAYEFLKG